MSDDFETVRDRLGGSDLADPFGEGRQALDRIEARVAELEQEVFDTKEELRWAKQENERLRLQNQEDYKAMEMFKAEAERLRTALKQIVDSPYEGYEDDHSMLARQALRTSPP